MPLIALGRLKPISNLRRIYGLWVPVLRGWGRQMFWQLMPGSGTCGVRISGGISLALSGAAADQGFGTADRLQAVGDWFGRTRRLSHVRAPAVQEAELCLRLLASAGLALVFMVMVAFPLSQIIHLINGLLSPLPQQTR